MTGSTTGSMTRAIVAWLAVIVPVWLVLALCTYWEPVLRDGWGHVSWHRLNHVTLHNLWEFAKGSYKHNNPRLGQTMTLLQHTPGPWHVIITPLFELALFYLLAVLALGRSPSWRRCDDALVFATIVALVFVCARSLGPMLFYRPFSGNYAFGLLVNVAWLVPFRLHAQEPRRARWWWTPLMLVLGVASGLSNEHTGPALVLAGLFVLVVCWRRGERFVPWALAGLAGMIAGGVMLFYAPGQEIRYNGLGAHQSVIDRILERTAYENGKILVLIVLYTAPMILWLVLGFVARARRRKVVANGPKAPVERVENGRAMLLLGVGLPLAIVLTLLASPKQGDRLYFAPICFAAAGVAGWLIAQLGHWERRIATVLAALAIAYVGGRLVYTYHTIGSEFAERMAIIEHGPPQSTVTVHPYSQKKSRYVLADDFEVATLRAGVAAMYNLAGIEIAP